MPGAGAPAHARIASSRAARTRAAGWRLAAAVPFAITFAFTFAFGVDFPRVDEWNMIPSMGRLFAGTFELADLWRFHNEHQAFFPHIVMLLHALATGWNLRMQMFVSIAFMAAAFLFLAWVLRRVERAPGWSLPVASLFVFSLHPIDTWIWACQIHVAMVVFGAVGALALLGAETLRFRTLLLSAFLGIVGSWSFLSGYVVWPVGAVALAMRPFGGARERIRALCAWIAAAALSVLTPLAFADPPPHAPIGGSVFGVLEFTARYLGTGLLGQGTPGWVLSAVGWIGFLASVAGGAWIAIRRRGSPATLALLAVNLFGLGNGVMIALGRLTMAGLEGAAASRYASFSGLSWILILILPWLVFERAGPLLRATRGAAAAIAVAALLLTQAPQIEAGGRTAEGRNAAAAAMKKGEGISWPALEAAFGGEPHAFLPRLGADLATLRSWKLSFFRDATPAELDPAAWPDPIVATLRIASEGGRRVGVIEARGGVPGNAAFAAVVEDGRPRTEGPFAFDERSQARHVFEIGAAPSTGSIAFAVMTFDRAGRLIQSAPVTVPR